VRRRGPTTLFADLSGVVVIPNVQIEEVRAVAREVQAADAAFAIAREQIRTNQSRSVTRRRSS
jgi:regulator of RNase E activity RraA